MADSESDDDRWSVRGVPKSYRAAATYAARRRKVGVGAWLCQAIDRAVQAERAPLVVTGPADRSSDGMSDGLSDAGAQLALIERAVAAAVALAEAPAVPTAFRRRANRLLREALPVAAVRGVDGQRRLPVDGARRSLVDGAARGPVANGVDADG
jgi:hypothetical protein